MKWIHLFFKMCLFFAKSNLSNRISTNISLISGKIRILLISAIWIGVMFGYAISLYFESYQSLSTIIFLTFLSVAMIAIMCIACPLLVIYNISKLNYQLSIAAAQKQMDDQVKYYETLVANDFEIKKFKHDFKNYHISIQELLVSGDVKGAIQYLDRLKRPLQFDSVPFDSGDRLLNVLLGDKQVQANKVHAKIVFDGMLPNRLLLPEDICLIFGNAIDNALEACEKLPSHEEKTIQVSCIYSSGFLFIKITNPVETDVQIVRNSIKSTKIDDTLHGIGLLSIRNAVERHSGVMSLKCSNKVFSFEVDLDFNMLAMSG